jgi:hypothetical protein
MANPRIEVEIGANVVGLTAGVNTATGQLDKLGKAAQTTAPQVQKLTQATSGYNSVGIDFARIVQDAPFGIIGVGNNITQLAQSFQTLKNTSGSTSAALKSAFASIFSSGNALILGISVLTTAFTILQQKGFFKSEESAKSLDEALKEYQETLTGVAAATLKGAQDAQKELAVLKSLEIQATNTAVSTDKRLQAVEQLQKQYPDYFGNLTKEQILNGQVGDAYLKVAANLLAKAKAQAATNQIAQNGIDLLRIETKLEEQRGKRLQETSAAQAQLDALIEKRQKEGFLTQGDLQRYDTLIKSINTANDSLSEEATLQGEITRINKENTQLTEQITKQIEAGATFTKDKVTAAKAVNIEKEKELKLEDEWKKKAEEIQRVLDTEAFLESREIKFDLNLEKFNKQIQDAFAPEKEIKVKIKTDVILDEDIPDELPFIDRLLERLNPKKFTEFEERTAEFATTMLGILDGGLANAFVDLGQSIGEALATGGNVLSAVGKSLLGSVGKLLGEFGKQLIAFGVAGLSYSKLIKSLFTNPATAAPKAGLAIAAGIALVALSGAISSGLKSNSGGSGGGGGGGGASVGSSGVGGGTSFAGGGQGGLFAQNRDLNGELVVRGQDLVYVFNQASNRINKG